MRLRPVRVLGAVDGNAIVGAAATAVSAACVRGNVSGENSTAQTCGPHLQEEGRPGLRLNLKCQLRVLAV
jgi:hypothetical protein